MNKAMISAVVAMACVGLAGGALAVPLSITYQGVLSEEVAGVVTNMSAPTATLEVRLYNAASGGTALWGHEISVTLDDGAFNMIISDAAGSAVAPPAVSAVLEDVIQDAPGPMYIGLTVSGGSEITPRQQMLSAPYAVAAKSAEKSAGSFEVGSNLNVSGNAVVEQQLEVVGSSSLSGNLAVVAPGIILGYGTIPLGGIIMWSGGAVPDGWALCDGTTVNGNVTPDLRGRFVLGSGSGDGLTPRTIGATSGDETVTLKETQMPPHTHNVDPFAFNTGSTGSHTHSIGARTSWQGDGGTCVKGDGNSINGSVATYSGGDHIHVIDVPNTISTSAGSGLPHNNMPPYYVLAYIMRVN